MCFTPNMFRKNEKKKPRTKEERSRDLEAIERARELKARKNKVRVMGTDLGVTVLYEGDLEKYG